MEEYTARAVQYFQNAYYMGSMAMREVVGQLALPNLIFAEPGIHLGKTLYAQNSHIFGKYKPEESDDMAKAQRLAAGKALYDRYKAYHASRMNTDDPVAKHYDEMQFKLPIFSFLHPNELGAEGYFQNIMQQFRLRNEPIPLRQSLLPAGGSLFAQKLRLKTLSPNLREMKVADHLGMVVLKLRGGQYFFNQFHNFYKNQLIFHLRRPVNNSLQAIVPNLVQASFPAWFDSQTGRSVELDAVREVWGCYPIIIDQLEDNPGLANLKLSNIAAVELQGYKLPTMAGSTLPVWAEEIQILVNERPVCSYFGRFDWAYSPNGYSSMRMEIR
jgi:hypothetical protein